MHNRHIESPSLTFVEATARVDFLQAFGNIAAQRDLEVALGGVLSRVVGVPQEPKRINIGEATSFVVTGLNNLFFCDWVDHAISEAHPDKRRIEGPDGRYAPARVYELDIHRLIGENRVPDITTSGGNLEDRGRVSRLFTYDMLPGDLRIIKDLAVEHEVVIPETVEVGGDYQSSILSMYSFMDAVLKPKATFLLNPKLSVFVTNAAAPSHTISVI